MPALSYPTGDFQPFTKILSSEVNGKFNAIKTLLNTTKLDSTNVQQNGLSWDRLTTQTASYLAATDVTGHLTVQAVATVAQGGTGINYAPVLADASKVLQVNQAGSALTFDSVPLSPSLRMYQWNHFV
jgi:hypothetical protein